MPNASIGGLASGLDTATIIDQLMQLEALPQTRLRNRVSTGERQVASLTTLNAKVASLVAKAETLTGSDGWSPLRTSSTLGKVTVSAGEGAAPTSFGLTVDRVALAHQLGFADSAALTDVVVGGGSTTVRIDRLDGTTLDLDTGDGTLGGLVAAINDPANESGLRATAVQVADGAYRLLVTAAETGAASDFTLANDDGSALLGGATVRAGQDAQVDLGLGITATSSTNTFEGLVDGLDVTLDPAVEIGASGTVSATRDSAELSTRVKSLVDGLNSVLTEIDSLTRYGTNGSGGGLLPGDSTLRNLRDTLVSTVYGDDRRSLADVGVQLDRDGKLTFDKEVFEAAYEADPTGVAARFDESAGGFAERLRVAADGASNTKDGTLTLAITGREAGVDRLNDSIEAWDIRLELRRTALTRQFTALETALSRMNSQSSWLSGQIASLGINQASSGS